jgi:hypothetical protein
MEHSLEGEAHLETDEKEDWIMQAMFRWVSIGVLAVMVGFWGGHAAWAAQEEIRIVSSDAYGLVMELHLPAFTLENVHGSDGSYQQIRLPGWASTTEAGRPQLPVRATLIQAPLSGGISFDILDEELEAVSGCKIAPVPSLRSMKKDGAGATTVLQKREAELDASELYPKARVELSERQFVREDCLVRIAVCPFQFNPSTGELRISKRMRISVRFESPLPSLRPEPLSSGVLVSTHEAAGVGEVFPKILSGSVPNYARREDALSTSPPESAETARAGENSILSGKTGLLTPQVTASGKSLRIEVKEDSIYRITYEDLLARELDPASMDPASLRMLNRGGEIALKVVSALTDRLSPGDVIEFYGRSINDSYTDTNVYWLVWGEGTGKRIESKDGSPTGQAKQINMFTDTVRLEENHVIWSFTPGAPDVDHWFWERITAPVTRTFTIQLSSVDAHQPPHAVLRVALRGATTMAPHPNHHTQIHLNGVEIGGDSWDGDIQYVHRMSIPKDLLKEGENTVSITMPGDTGAAVDSVFLNWIEVSYRRFLEAQGDRLSFQVKGEERLAMEVRKLSGGDARIFDITDPASPREILGATVAPDGELYTAIFEDQVDGKRTYFVLTDDQVKSPDDLAVWKPANLSAAKNGADYILISSKPFLSSMSPLMKLHRSRGMRVKAVGVEDIYNEFNHGIFHPSAIKDFLKAAYANWQKPAPTYVLLVGDANGDYRDYLGTGKKNIVPPHLSFTAGLGLTPDDGWYVSIRGRDILPDMLIGRLSASTPEAASQVAAKVVAHEEEKGYRPEAALFIADDDETAFEAINEELITTLPKNFSARRVYLSKAKGPGSARRAIVNAINKGMLFTNYAGHGNTFYWAEEKIFRDSDVAALTNAGKLTFVTSLDCFNGFFSHPSQYSLGELFVITPEKGAIGSFAPSGTGYPWEHDLLGKALFSAVFQKGDRILGSFTTRAKIQAYAKGATGDIVKCYSLMGDPASRLKMVK